MGMNDEVRKQRLVDFRKVAIAAGRAGLRNPENYTEEQLIVHGTAILFVAATGFDPDPVFELAGKLFEEVNYHEVSASIRARGGI